MIIENNKVVSLTYELRVNDNNGEIIEKVEKESPLTFVFGKGSLLPDFEANVKGLKVGDPFSFILEPEKAYGNVSQEAIVDIPKSIFEVDGKIQDGLLAIGRSIPMQDNSGNRLNGLVKELTDETVTMDFNHPLAGDTLYFSGTVACLREATQEELDHGHVHAGSHPCGEEEGKEGDGGCGCGCN